MEHPSLTFIMRNPNGAVSLMSQPHMNNKRHLQCKNCPASIIYTRGQQQVCCSRCLKKAKISKEISVDQQLECPMCSNQMKIKWMGEMIYKSCNGCGMISTNL